MPDRRPANLFLSALFFAIPHDIAPGEATEKQSRPKKCERTLAREIEELEAEIAPTR